jgi:hypothetical protein
MGLLSVAVGNVQQRLVCNFTSTDNIAPVLAPRACMVMLRGKGREARGAGRASEPYGL